MLNKTVWKYKFGSGKIDKIEMIRGAVVIRVALQGNDLCLWACVVPDASLGYEKRSFLITLTGEVVPMKANYMGSVSTGPFELHVWEMPNGRAKRVLEELFPPKSAGR